MMKKLPKKADHSFVDDGIRIDTHLIQKIINSFWALILYAALSNRNLAYLSHCVTRAILD